jgi:hypothetical protein
MGETLDKQAVIQFATELSNLIGQIVKDESVLDKINAKMIQLITKVGKEEDTEEGIL